MNVLVLSAYPEQLSGAWTDEHIHSCLAPSEEDYAWADWVVSYGHRKIIKSDVLGRFPGCIINIHISILPWNRGADPNFWSFFDNTPKGITIHQMDTGIDTGPILAQAHWHPESKDNHTLLTSYEALQKLAAKTFIINWPMIRNGHPAVSQPERGTYHRRADGERWIKGLALGWDTPVADIEETGRRFRERVA